jgi:hypothetical protein
VWALGAVRRPAADRPIRARRTSGSTANWTGGPSVLCCIVDCASLSYVFKSSKTEPEKSVAFAAIGLARLGHSIRILDRRTDLHLRGNGVGRRRMDRLLRAATWHVSERIWDDDAFILLGGTADWPSRRTDSFETHERGGPGVDQPARGGGRSGGHPFGKQPDDRFIRRRSGWVGAGRRLSHHFCDLHPALREAGVAIDWIRLCARRDGRSVDSLAGWIDFGKVRGLTHRTSHSTVLRGVDDCLADCNYPGAGSGAFAKSPISIVFVNRLPALRTRSRSQQKLLSQKLSLAGKEPLSSSAFETQAAQCQMMFDLPPSPELSP